MAICVIVLAFLVAYVVYSNFKPDELPSYQLAEVKKGDVQATFDTQGTVESGTTETFTAASGVRVLTVNVAVGDRVTAGQQLATFDTASLNEELAAYKSAYDKAKASYDEAAAGVSQARKNAKATQAEVASLEKACNQLEKEIAAAEKAAGEAPSTPIDEAQLQALLEQLRAGGFTEAQLQALLQAIRAQGENIDVRAVLEDSLAGKRMELLQKQAQLSALQTQATVYESQTDETVMSLYKTVMETKAADYEAYRATVSALKDGWFATADGLVTEVNLVAGEDFVPSVKTGGASDLSSLMSMASGNGDVMSTLADILSATSGGDTSVGTGIVLQSTGAFYASFTVGKYDLLDLKVGQPATITSLDKTYDATVSYVSATATASSGLDISSITSSLTGGGASGSSSSAAAQVKILNPDEKVILGFDVDIRINTERLENVIVLPVEAVSTIDSENFVFIYNAEEETVEKRAITLGLGSDEVYEVLDGISIGEQVVLNPKTVLQDGDKIAVKA